MKNPMHVPGKDVSLFSQYALYKPRALLKHVIRAPSGHPLRECTFETATSVPLGPNNLRVGRPRSKWAYSLLEGLYVEKHGTPAEFRRNLVQECNDLGNQIKARIL